MGVWQSKEEEEQPLPAPSEAPAGGSDVETPVVIVHPPKQTSQNNTGQDPTSEPVPDVSMKSEPEPAPSSQDAQAVDSAPVKNDSKQPPQVPTEQAEPSPQQTSRGDVAIAVSDPEDIPDFELWQSVVEFCADTLPSDQTLRWEASTLKPRVLDIAEMLEKVLSGRSAVIRAEIAAKRKARRKAEGSGEAPESEEPESKQEDSVTATPTPQDQSQPQGEQKQEDGEEQEIRIQHKDRARVVLYLSSPQCYLFNDEVVVTAHELDRLLVTGKGLENTLRILEIISKQNRTFVYFDELTDYFMATVAAESRPKPPSAADPLPTELLEVPTPLAVALLKKDRALRELRRNFVPKRFIKEKLFWHEYARMLRYVVRDHVLSLST